MPSAILIGNIGQEPELRLTPNGKTVCNFTLALDRGKDTGGQRQEPLWVNVTAWAPLCFKIKAHLIKGNRVQCSGLIDLRYFNTAAGDKKAAINLTAFDARRVAQAHEFEQLPDVDEQAVAVFTKTITKEEMPMATTGKK